MQTKKLQNKEKLQRKVEGQIKTASNLLHGSTIEHS